jgi:hypothetical protein
MAVTRSDSICGIVTHLLFIYANSDLNILGFPFPLGNPTIVILVLPSGGVQLISIGILAETIRRIDAQVNGGLRMA